MTEKRPSRTKNILVVDDEPLNRKLLRGMLTINEFQVTEAPNGRVALELARSGPDLILLDIMMPVLDGFETCRQLKSDPQTRDIPVLFLSALMEADNRVTGFRSGGLDYICKPFNQEELLARIRTHLTLRDQKSMLQQYNEELEQMVEERTRQLVHADRLATLGTLVAALAHEINNPLHGMLANVELGKKDLESVQKKISLLPGKEEQNWLFELAGKMEKRLMIIKQCGEQISQLVNQLKGYGRKETQVRKNLLLIEPIQDALSVMGPRLKKKGEVILNVPPGMHVLAARQYLAQVFNNLISNALEALEGAPCRIEISAQVLNDREIAVEMRDNGPGVPADLENRIFEPFVSSKMDKGGTGLGLFIVQTLVEEQRGRISLIPHTGEGACFQIILPRPND